MYNRYHDIKKFITDLEKLQMVNESEVYISSEENYDIVVDLKGHTADFENLPLSHEIFANLIILLKNLTDCIARAASSLMMWRLFSLILHM